MNGKPRLFRLSYKIAIMAVCLIIVSTAVIGAYSYYNYRERSIELKVETLEQIARSSASLVDPAQYREVMANMEANDYHHWLADRLAEMTVIHELLTIHIGEIDPVTGFLCFVEPSGIEMGAHLGAVLPPENFPQEAYDAMAYGIAYPTEPLVAAEYNVNVPAGIFIAVYAPVFDENGNTIAIVSACLNDHSIYADSQAFAVRIFWIVLAAIFVLIWIPLFYSRRSIGKPISKLSSATNAIVGGDLSNNIEIKSKDEFNVLAKNFMAMQASIREKIETEIANKKLLASVNSAATILLAAGNDEDVFDRSLQEGIEALGKSVNADCVEIWQNETDGDKRTTSMKYCWYSEAASKLKAGAAKEFSYNDYPSYYDKMQRGEIVEGPVSELSGDEQRLFSDFGIKSTLNMPIFIDGMFWGLYCVDDMQSARHFSGEEIDILRTSVLMITNAINRRLHEINMRESERAAHQAELAKGKAEAAADAMKESITYASKIQRNLLPHESEMAAVFSDYSVVWKPRDIVGGDVYWMKQFKTGTVLCVADCTGHGTPGALLTTLVTSALESIVWDGNCDDTADILWQLDRRLSGVLHVDKSGETRRGIMDIDDGCDIAVMFIAQDKSVLFSSGNIPIFICDGETVVQHKGQKLFIGENKLKSSGEVKAISIPANPKNKFYIASDGLFDQIGGERGIQFGYDSFKKIILESHSEKQSVITAKIWDAYEQYRGDEAQRDDFELVAFKP